MPDYNFTLTVPADTKRDAPVEVEMELTKGVIASAALQFPAGCSGLVHVIIADSKQQLYPANADDTYHGDNINIQLVGRHELDNTPYKLLLKGWSPGTLYSHTIQFAISILPEEEASPYKTIADLVAILKTMLGLE